MAMVVESRRLLWSGTMALIAERRVNVLPEPATAWRATDSPFLTAEMKDSCWGVNGRRTGVFICFCRSSTILLLNAQRRMEMGGFSVSGIGMNMVLFPRGVRLFWLVPAGAVAD